MKGGSDPEERGGSEKNAMKEQGIFFYEAEVEWTGERKGDLRSSNLPDLQVASPPEFRGHEATWTPEHLYVASVVSCFMTTFLAIAQNSKLEIVSFSATARGKLEKIEGLGYQMTEIILKPRLVIRSSRDLERAARIVEKAEKNCLISNSIRSTVRLEPQIYHHQLPGYPCPSVSEGTGGSE